jgi:NAD(P)-dependent dehydrogenase (short-subunit alcohol dehydrogenase family)
MASKTKLRTSLDTINRCYHTEEGRNRKEVSMTMFKDKVAVITGASSGIGKCIAERAAREGMKIVLAGINMENLVKVEKELNANGATAICIKTDVSKKNDIDRLARQTIEEFGAVHILFNNAGIAGGKITETTIEDWEWIIGVNLWGVIYGIHAFLPIMRAQNDECHIVNTASMSGLVASGGLGTYCVTKYGVVALSEALYRELTRDGSKVKVTVVCPAYVRTKILDPGRNRPGRDLSTSQSNMTEKDMDAIYNSIRIKTNSEVLSPEIVADRIFMAIQNNKLYVLTHPEAKQWVRTRMEDVINEQNPILD